MIQTDAVSSFVLITVLKLRNDDRSNRMNNHTPVHGPRCCVCVRRLGFTVLRGLSLENQHVHVQCCISPGLNEFNVNPWLFLISDISVCLVYSLSTSLLVCQVFCCFCFVFLFIS